MNLHPHPEITKTIPIEGGYTARALCRIDDFPGEVRLNVDTQHSCYSSFAVYLFNPVEFRWMLVDTMPIEEMPRSENEETLTWLNRIAYALWTRTDMIVRAGNRRQEQWETDLFLAQQLELRHALNILENATQDAFTAVDRGVLVEDQ